MGLHFPIKARRGGARMTSDCEGWIVFLVKGSARRLRPIPRILNVF